ncbi:MAG: histidinol-phosphatase [Gammaproteobacteria bacterium]|nr:histidinol-phosphatase [Gammaproteobacteria bacterium]
MTKLLEKELALAERLADTSGGISLKYFRRNLAIEDKLDASPVTIADREIETLLREMILSEFPEHGIFGEEFGTQNLQADSVWIIDPIDGTGSFVYGLPLYGCLVSLVQNRKPVLGVIDMPALGERWIGRAGGDTMHSGEVCRTSNCTNLANAKLLCTTPDMFTPEEFETFSRISQAVKMRRFGGDCLCYGLLASGHVDLVVESDLKPYDFMAHVAVVEGAGGVISDWQGNPLSMDSGTRVVAAATAELHARALEILARD